MANNLKIDDLRLIALREAGKKLLPEGFWQGEDGCHLTFDDGPSPHTTDPLLELLEAKNVRATFFFTGENARLYPDLVKKTQEAGHQIGNHSLEHRFSYMESHIDFQKGVEETNKIIARITGETPVVYRPPFGVIDAARAKIIKERAMKLVYWGALAEDWIEMGAIEVTRRIMNQVQPGTIIVLHEAEVTKLQCLNATDAIIDQVHERQLSFSTIEGP